MKQSDSRIPVELLAVDPDIRSLLDVSNLSCNEFDINKTIERFQKAVKSADDRTLIRDRALAEAALASAYIGNGQIEVAYTTFQKALQDAIDSRNKVLEADLLLSLSSQAQMRENRLQTADLIAKALSLSEKTGSLYEKTRALGERGQQELLLGKLDEATQSIDQALEIDTLNGYRFEALHLVYRGYYLGVKGKTDAAIDSLIQARTKALAANDIYTFISAENAYAYGLVQKKRGDEAVQELVQLKQGNVQQFARQAKDQTCLSSALMLPLVHLIVLEGLANIYEAIDQKEKQLDIWEEIQLYSHDHGVVAGEAEAAEKAGLLCSKLKKTDQAVQHYSVAVDLLRKLQNEVALDRVEISQSLLLVEIGRGKEALPLVHEIEDYARRQKLRSLEFAANLELAQIYQPDGDLDHARDSLEKAVALVQPGPFDSEFDNRPVLVAYVRLNEIYKALKMPTQELINIVRAFFVAVHLKDENAQKSEAAYLDQRLKDLRTREVVEESLKNGHFAESLIYSIILYLHDGFPSKPSDDQSNLDRIGNLPSQIVLQPGGAKALAKILHQFGPFLESEKVPALVSLGRYYIGAGTNPILAEQYASAALKLLDDAKVDNVPNRVESTCVLALSYANQDKNALATEKIAECLNLSQKTNEQQSITYAALMNAMVQSRIGNYAAAKTSLEELIARVPDNPGLQVELAISLASAKLFDKASSQLDYAIQKLISLGDKKTAAGAYARISFVLNTDSSGKAQELQLEYLSASRRLYKELGDQTDEAQELVAIGDHYLKLEQTKRAVDSYSAALGIAQKVEQPSIVAEALLGLGNGYKAQRDFNPASEFHAKAASAYHEVHNAPGEAISLSNLATDYDELGETDRALSSFLEAKRAAKNAPALNRYVVDYFLGDFYRKQGQFEKALATYKEALEITTQEHDIEHSGYSHLAIGSLDTVIGDWDDAISESQAALDLFQKIGNKKGQGVSWALLTAIYSERSSPFKSFEKAREYYAKAQEFDYGKTLQLDIMEIYLQTGKYSEAAQIASESIQECLTIRDTDCQAHGLLSLSEAERLNGNLKRSRSALNKARPLASKSQDVYLRGRLLYAEARLLASEGKLDEALTSYKQLISVIETLKGNLGTQEQKSVSENYGYIYDELISLLYSMSKKTPGSQLLLASNSLEYAEINKARQFTASWGRVFVNQMRLALPPTTQEREQALFSQRDRALAQLEANLNNVGPNQKATRDRLEAELSSVQREIEAFLNDLRKTAPQYAAIAYPDKIQISSLPLRKGETFVEFKMTDDATFAWIVQNRNGTKNDLVSFYKIPQTRAWFLDRISFLRRALNSGRPEAIDWKVSEELFAALFPAEASRVIAESREIIFVPDDVLFALPFELFSPAASQNDFVFLKKATVYYPSAVSFRLARTAVHPSDWQESFLGLADPITSPEDERFEIAKSIAAGVMRSSSRNGESQVSPAGPSTDRLKARGFSFERLPGTAVEIHKIADLLQKTNGRVEIRIGVDATKNELLNTDLSKFRFLHFATHGVLPVDTSIREPALVLSYDGVSPSHMFLSMSEILALRLQAESVVLSACNTGSGSISRAEGVMSLGRAFLAAGSSSVIVSLWQVSDESTAELMEKYYQGVLAGKPKNIALAEARQALFSSRYKDPFYWAPFILIGE